MDRQRRQLENLLDLLNLQQDKVNNFCQEIEINANPEIRFQIQQRVKREVVPRLDNYRQEKPEICSEIPDELRELCEQIESLIKAIERACQTILKTSHSSNQPSKPPSNLNKQGSSYFVGRSDLLLPRSHRTSAEGARRKPPPNPNDSIPLPTNATASPFRGNPPIFP